MIFQRRRFGLVHELIDSEGRVVGTIDAREWNVNRRLAIALLKAEEAEYGHYDVKAQYVICYAIRKLNAALVEAGLSHDLPLPSSCASQIHQWLTTTKLSSNTRQIVQVAILTLLKWCHRNLPGILEKKALFTVPAFEREPSKPKRKLTEAETKSVLAACYSDIEAIEARIRRGAILLNEKGCSAEDVALAVVVRELLVVGGGVIPSITQIARKNGLRDRMNLAGGLRFIRKLLYLSHADVFVFYLAAVVQSGANPGSARLADTKTVIKPHPLRADLEVLDWDKQRAKRTQRIDFPTGRAWSAPNIIRRLLSLNSGLRHSCRDSDKDMVFLAVSVQGGRPTVPSNQTLYNNLEEFIERHGLPKFVLKDWRPTVARAHHVAGGSIEVARRRLNHRFTSTTMGYSGQEDVSVANDEAILRFQGELVRGESIRPQGSGGKGPDVLLGSEAPAETVFGFKCKNPMGGLDEVTPKGVRCINFTGCSGCKGSLVTLDDPVVVARLLGARDALQQTRKRALSEGWWPRFNALYEDTFIVISKELLPAVAEPLLVAARRLAKAHYVPHLE